MKKIKAVIRKSKFDEVKEALHKSKSISLLIGMLPGG
jgi:nitrogen regulatory protein PII